MRIYPRILICDDDENESYINISNSSNSRVLLFKVRRSEPKVIDFQPKRGTVEAGKTLKVYVKLHANALNARILVQLVTVKRDNFCDQFDTDWNTGYQRGVVKKVVFIQNNRSSFDTLSILSQDVCEVKRTDDKCIQNVLNTNQQSLLTVIESGMSLMKNHHSECDNDKEKYLNDTMNSSVISFGEYMSSIETAKKSTNDMDMTLVTYLNSSKVSKKKKNPILLASRRPLYNIKNNGAGDEGFSIVIICSWYFSYHCSLNSLPLLRHILY